MKSLFYVEARAFAGRCGATGSFGALELGMELHELKPEHLSNLSVIEFGGVVYTFPRKSFNPVSDAGFSPASTACS